LYNNLRKIIEGKKFNEELITKHVLLASFKNTTRTNWLLITVPNKFLTHPCGWSIVVLDLDLRDPDISSPKPYLQRV